jgi:hypothetical protein
MPHQFHPSWMMALFQVRIIKLLTVWFSPLLFVPLASVIVLLLYLNARNNTSCLRAVLLISCVTHRFVSATNPHQQLQ